jgi:uncharacterized membrane protein YgaE (UPF0421/DUF939 family)
MYGASLFNDESNTSRLTLQEFLNNERITTKSYRISANDYNFTNKRPFDSKGDTMLTKQQLQDIEKLQKEFRKSNKVCENSLFL